MVIIERCPETHIVSIVKEGGEKVDLMPDEAAAIQQAGSDTAAIRTLVAACNKAFAEGLTEDELNEIAARFA
jgi:hypothetical protein